MTGSLEVLIVIAVLVVLAVIVTIIIIGAFTRDPNRHRLTPPGTPISAQELDHVLRRLVHDGQKIHAIKMLRDHTGMSLKDAKNAIDGLALGHPVHYPPSLAGPPPPPMPSSADLATRVRHLKETGRTEQAIHLVRGETGMDEAEATQFVNSIRS